MNDAMSALERQIQELSKENKRLARELERQRAVNKRNQTIVEANASLSEVISKEKSQLEQYMSLLLENCPDIILFFDCEGRVVYASKSYLEIIGVSSAGIIRGKTFEELMSPVSASGILLHTGSINDRVLAAGERIETEYDIDFSGTGNARHYVIQITPMLEERGDAAGAMAIFYDSTEIVKARDEAEAARRAAEQSNRAKSDFLSRMSHEMRTPLNAIIGMSDIARKSDDMERVQYALAKVNEASRHLLGVINDILDISKIEAGRFELYYDDFNFEDMLRRVIAVNNYRIEEKRQSLLVNVDKSIPRVIVSDEQRLAQVVTNLLSNAVKFTNEQGAIRVNAQLDGTQDDVFMLRVEVSDDGIGISAEQQLNLFSNFEQGDGSISRKYGGTGLGLAISRRIVEMMGGEIWLESEPGEGSTFSFRIPVRQGMGAPRNILRPDARISNIRVLAVDDMQEVRNSFHEITRRFGIWCDTAPDAETALEMLSGDNWYDIYFVDWQMPGIDGIELAQTIKNHGPENSIVIMISATDWDVISNYARSSGVDGFLPKPIYPSDIFDCISSCLGLDGSVSAEMDEPQYDFSEHRILIAEDVEINREIVAALLEPTGVTIDFAANGKQAVELFAAQPSDYSLIFMDVQMPEMDGYEATHRIRALEPTESKRIPIIAMTANVFREDIDKCLDAGMNGHVGKPMNMNEVFAQMRKYMRSG